jgi:hypothetical protein
MIGKFIRDGLFRDNRLFGLLSKSDIDKYFIQLCDIVASNAISQLLPLGLSNHKLNILAREYGISKLDVSNLIPIISGNVCEEQIRAFVGGESNSVRLTESLNTENGATQGRLLLEILELMNISPVIAVKELPRFAEMLNILYHAELNDEDLSESGLQYADLRKYQKYIMLEDHTICHRLEMSNTVNGVMIALVHFLKRGRHQERGEWNGKCVLPKKGKSAFVHLNVCY